jgi:hypothetical protein
VERQAVVNTLDDIRANQDEAKRRKRGENTYYY